MLLHPHCNCPDLLLQSQRKGVKEMKDFNEFGNYLMQRINEEPEGVPALAKLYCLKSLSPEDLSAFMGDYAKVIATYSSELAMYYLRIYHEWMQQQLP